MSSHPPLLRRVLVGIAAIAAVVLVATGCGGSTTSSNGDGLTGTIDVSAAASLAGAFAEAETVFEAAHPGARVTINVGASSTLATQITSGAPVDVFASADRRTMARVADDGLLADAPVILATNALQIIVRSGNPDGIERLADLARPGIVVVTCSTDVPIGAYTAEVLRRAGVSIAPRSIEPDVKGIIAKVVSGEADAGIVYSTDIAAADGDATGVVIPEAENVVASYPIAMLATTSHPRLARAWIDFIVSPEGRAILERFGFGAP